MKCNLLWRDEIKDKENNPICVYDVCLSPDGRTLLVGADNRIFVYDPAGGGTQIQSLKGHKDTVLALSFAHDGKRFASGGSDKQVIIWTAKMEGILKYSHNDSVRSIQYNPTSYQLLSCTSSDFGLWSPEQKNVNKIKVLSPINCCCWQPDGLLFAIGFQSGNVSIRFKNGDEKMKIERKAAVWSLLFYPWSTTPLSADEDRQPNFDCYRLAIGDWSKTLSIYDACDQNQNIPPPSPIERTLQFDPLFITGFGDDFLLIGGTNKQVGLYTKDGLFLETIVREPSWIWCCQTSSNSTNQFVIGCQNGSLAMFNLSLMTIHCLYKTELFAFRHSMTDIVIQRLDTKDKARIKCRDSVKKIAIYKALLAIQLQKQIILYEYDDKNNNELNYRVKEKIKIELDDTCSHLMLASGSIILAITGGHRKLLLRSLNFNGRTEKEWNLSSTIGHARVMDGIIKQEPILLGLHNGQIILVLLSSLFPVDLIKIPSPIRWTDMNLTKNRLAIIDSQNLCSVYDLNNKKLIFEEPDVTSASWNSHTDDLLCFATDRFVAIRMDSVPMQIIEFAENLTVIGFSGDQIHLLDSTVIDSRLISYSKLMVHFLQQQPEIQFEEAYRKACLNGTADDWNSLCQTAMVRCHPICRRCLPQVEEWSYQDLIYNHFNQPAPESEPNRTLFLAKYHAYRGLFSEAAKLYRKIGKPELAKEMFTDLQMYDQAKEYQQQNNESNDQTETFQPVPSASDLNDLRTLVKIYTGRGEHGKAFEMLVKNDVNSIMAFVEQMDRGETKLLYMIAEYFVTHEDYIHAIDVYRKIGDFKQLALTYIKNNQWEQAFKIANEIPQLKQEIYLPYGWWLAQQERFAEAQQAFNEAGRFEESKRVLTRLLANSINECRFSDASYYSWLLSVNNQYDQKQEMEAEMYHAYQYIYQYIEEPFTSIYPEILFNSAMFLFQFIDENLPNGMSKVYILFALTKLCKTLGHFKLIRIAYKKLRTLRWPENLMESIMIGSLEIRTKPFVDAEELSMFCYRCSSSQSLFNSKSNQCINCGQIFIHSFYSFDILPLVEFELDPSIDQERFEKTITENTDRPIVDRSGKRSSYSAVDGSGVTNIYTMADPDNDEHDDDAAAAADDDDDDGRQIHRQQQSIVGPEKTINLSEEINPMTNLAVVNERHLNKLNLCNVIIGGGSSNVQQQRHKRYYLNMMPEIGIVACPNCGKFFYSDEYEFHILKNGHCLFCRK